MKTLKNAKFLAVFAVALVVATALVAGCLNPVKILDQLDNPTIPEGMGVVRLNFGDSARTIMPKEVPNIVRYDVVFKRDGGSTTTEPLYSSSFPSMTLAAGKYTLEVKGYTEYIDSTNNKPVAIASTSLNGTITSGKPTILSDTVTPGFEIEPGQTTTLIVILKPIDPKDPNYSGKGTLAYDINLTSPTNPITDTITHARMTLMPYPTGTALPYIDLNPTGKTTSTVPNIPSGYYWVDIQVQTEGKGIKYRDLAHIYQNMTSRFEVVFTDNMLMGGGSGSGNTNNSIITFPVPNNPNILLPFDVSSVFYFNPLPTVTGSGTQDDPFIMKYYHWNVNASSTSGITLTATNTTDYTYTWYNEWEMLKEGNSFTIVGVERPPEPPTTIPAYDMYLTAPPAGYYDAQYIITLTAEEIIGTEVYDVLIYFQIVRI
jgi:hypothetical protein